MMERFARDYYLGLEELLKSLDVTDKQQRHRGLYKGVVEAAELIKMQTDCGRKVVFIGNGASAAISSHQATDFWKSGGMKAVAFNDASGLTCISNDFGYEHVFEKPIEMFVDSGDVLVAISSSGRSRNILLGVQTALAKDAKVITLSGFAQDNPLRKLGEINFYVPSMCYGHVEILHHSICHCLLDTIVHERSELSREVLVEPRAMDTYIGVQDVRSRKGSRPEIQAVKSREKYNKRANEKNTSKSSYGSEPKGRDSG
jgi:D-sedoheptulose 7-phosphate isomerase